MCGRAVPGFVPTITASSIEPVGEAPVSLNGRPITVPTRGASQSLEASLAAVPS
jgi:hypothetical protein